MYKKEKAVVQKMKEVEAPTVLPALPGDPGDLIRLPVIDLCLAGLVQKDEKDSKNDIHRPNCNKVFTHPDGKQVCISYLDPECKWKIGCALASNKINIEAEQKRIRVGQQKQRSWKK